MQPAMEQAESLSGLVLCHIGFHDPLRYQGQMQVAMFFNTKPITQGARHLTLTQTQITRQDGSPDMGSFGCKCL